MPLTVPILRGCLRHHTHYDEHTAYPHLITKPLEPLQTLGMSRGTCSGEGSSRHDASDQAAVTYNVDNVSSRDSVEVGRGIAP